MTENAHDISILRDLASRYAEIAAKPVQEERRQLWRRHFSLKPTRPPVLATYGIWNVWCREVFGDHALSCRDPFYREHERFLRMEIFHDSVGDDYIIEPWITQLATLKTPRGIYGEAWGAPPERTLPGVEGGAWKGRPFLQSWEDFAQNLDPSNPSRGFGQMAGLVPPRHEIDEAATARDVERLQEAVGDILEVNVNRGPVLWGFAADLSTTSAALRGLDRMMLDMYEAPQQLKALLIFLRDGVLANQQQAEEAGDLSLTNHQNQAMPYAEELESPRANSGPRRRRDLWGFCAAQEYTLVSPRFHDEFLFQQQMRIMEHFGLVHYGCCEDLTCKIDMLRQLKNLRSIAVTPRADVRRCAEQIGRDYVISWRPNPADMVCTSWDETRIRRIIGEGLAACRGGYVHVHLKDIETVQGETNRLARWAAIVRELAEGF